MFNFSQRILTLASPIPEGMPARYDLKLQSYFGSLNLLTALALGGRSIFKHWPELQLKQDQVIGRDKHACTIIQPIPIALY